MRSFPKNFLSAVVMLSMVGFCHSSAMATGSEESTDSPVIAQGDPPNASCQMRDWACTGGVVSNKPCCGPLICVSGFCKLPGTRGQQCGTPANPPCGSGLNCINGTCQ